MTGSYKNLILVSMMAVSLVFAGCAKKKEPINLVDTKEYLDKTELTGKTFSFVQTISQGDEQLDSAGIIPGFHMDYGFVQFKITEDQLQVLRVNDVNRGPQTNVIVAAFPITSQFDIRPEINDYGDQTNKTIEDTKQPWYKRQFIRVDWGSNKVKATDISGVFSPDVDESEAKTIVPLYKSGNMYSFDVDEAIEYNDQIGELFDMPVPGSMRAHFKNAFLEIDPQASDFKQHTYNMPNTDFKRFGFFRNAETFVDADKGPTISGLKQYANIYNVCEKSDETKNLSCSKNKITYVLNQGFPEEFKQAARDVVDSWNKTFKTALGREDDVVVLDESVEPEIGDIRYNMIAAIDEKIPTSLLGVSQTVNNPLTGETIAARASVYLGSVRTDGGLAGEMFDVIMADQPKANPPSKYGELAFAGSNLLEDLKGYSKVLGIDKYKVDTQMTQAALHSPDIFASKAKENINTAQAGWENALTKASSQLEFSDAAWRAFKAKINTQRGQRKLQALSSADFGQNVLKKISSELYSKDRTLNEARFGTHYNQSIEPAIEMFVQKFIAQHQGESPSQLREELKREVRYLVFYSTLIHEMGHNFGLRHNFASSSDNKNYTAKYYELERQKLGLSTDSAEYKELSLEQESYDFSSVMDYTSDFIETRGGTGPYDLAAIRYAYNLSLRPKTDSSGKVSKDPRNEDEVTNTSHGYKFCTDHEVGEDLLCQRWDKGVNVSQTVSNKIKSYNRNYIFRNFRRDRLSWGDPSSYFSRVLVNTMFPIRQVSDEFVYQMVKSKRVASTATQCSAEFINISVRAGEVANPCDAATYAAYGAKGIDVSDVSNWPALLVNPETGKLIKDPSTYTPNGFADLLYANLLAENFFQNVLGAPEPGLYIADPNANGVMELNLLPEVEGGEGARLMAYFRDKGIIDPNELAAKIQAGSDMLVDLKAGPQAKLLESMTVQDGSFFRVDGMGYVIDKQAALVMMGFRGLPVEKYEREDLNGNMYLSPITTKRVTGIINKLVNVNEGISRLQVKTHGGTVVTATVPASLNQETQVYATVISMSDFIALRQTDFADKIRICTDQDVSRCKNPYPGMLKEVSFRSANAQDNFRAMQVLSSDSISYDLVVKGDRASKRRDQAYLDLQPENQKLIKQKLTDYLAGKVKSTPATRQAALMNFAKTKAPQVEKTIRLYFGASEASTHNFGIWQTVMDAALEPEKASARSVVSLGNDLPDVLEQARSEGDALLKDNEKLKAEFDSLASPVIADMMMLNTLTARLIGSRVIFDSSTSELSDAEINVQLVRSIGQILGVN